MSDRKYSQRGYQNHPADRRPADAARPAQTPRPERPPGAPAGARRISADGARNPRMVDHREVARCARCGTLVDPQVLSRSTCPKCQQALHACVQCTHFDPAARFECSRPLTVRVSPKDAANECPLFEARTSWERETSAAASATPPGAPRRDHDRPASSSARKAFDDLFKF